MEPEEQSPKVLDNDIGKSCNIIVRIIGTIEGIAEGNNANLRKGSYGTVCNSCSINVRKIGIIEGVIYCFRICINARDFDELSQL